MKTNEASERVRAVLESCDARARKILRLRYGIDTRPHSLAEVAVKLRMSRLAVRAIEAEALQKLGAIVHEGKIRTQ